MAKREIAGLRAIITGASSGIGRAIALELAAQGADGVLLARRSDRLQEVVQQVEACGRKAFAVAGDIADAAARQAAVDCAQRELGGLDLLVNNAGISAVGPFATANPERLRQLFEVNVFGLIEMTRAALPLLRHGHRPIIVNIASVLSHVALPSMSEYCATKHAVRGFSNSLRAELRPHGIDVLLVCPATVETELWERMVEVTEPPAWRARRGATPEFIAKKTIAGIRKGRREVVPGLLPRSAVLVNRLFPGLVAWLTAKRR